MMPLHTDRTFDEDLEKLRTSLLEMGMLVDDQIGRAMRALAERDEALARATIDRDHTVNRLDVEIDDLAIKLLALRQPAARDLRLITTALKISTDLERVGDMASHMAERACELAAEPPIHPGIDLSHMAGLARDMLQRALDAFVRGDAGLALAVCQADDAVDKLHDQFLRDIASFMTAEPRAIGRAMRFLFVSKNLERVADHATNIAEMVIFLVKGRSIRHLDAIPRDL
jgi:phosphate transport system protein